MSLNNKVWFGKSKTGENKPCFNLVFIKEATIRLIHFATNNFANTGRASTSPAWVGKVNAFILFLIKNVFIVRTFKLLWSLWSDQLHILSSHGSDTTSTSSFYTKHSVSVGKCLQACCVHWLAPQERGAHHSVTERGCGAHSLALQSANSWVCYSLYLLQTKELVVIVWLLTWHATLSATWLCVMPQSICL